MRIDRLVANLPTFNRQQAQLALALGQVEVDGQRVTDSRLDVRSVHTVTVRGLEVQRGRPARYLMLHKPAGCVSATSDPAHPTVLELLPPAERAELHLTGRLDYNTTGLVLLTNDGLWSRRLTLPGSKLPKRYYVETEQPIEPEYAQVFHDGVFFAFEGLTTQPAVLEVLGPREAYLTLVEGRYHQVKRMFGYFQNKVTHLHRLAIGPLTLDPALAPGQYRPLSEAELHRVADCVQPPV